MSAKLYVGNLGLATNNKVLGNMFGVYGAVDFAMVVKDRVTRLSKGFGMVEMSRKADADTAISALNGKYVDGQNLIVKNARRRDTRPR